MFTLPDDTDGVSLVGKTTDADVDITYQVTSAGTASPTATAARISQGNRGQQLWTWSVIIAILSNFVIGWI